VNVIAVVVIHLLPVFGTVIIQDPAQKFARFGAEWHSRKQRCCVHFALPVTGGLKTRINGSVRNRVQRFQCRNKFARIEMLEFYFGGNPVDFGYKIGRRCAQNWQVFAKCGRHFQRCLCCCDATHKRKAGNCRN